jgi:mitochondrial fission protein ELM1
LRRKLTPSPIPALRSWLSGESAAFSFPPELATTLGAVLARLARKNSGSLLVTPSRGTRVDSLAALSDVINGMPHLDWNGTGDNPYSAFLALSDAIVTTEDSVNMVTEAAATGKPVYVQRLKGSWTRLMRFTN